MKIHTTYRRLSMGISVREQNCFLCQKIWQKISQLSNYTFSWMQTKHRVTSHRRKINSHCHGRTRTWKRETVHLSTWPARLLICCPRLWSHEQGRHGTDQWQPFLYRLTLRASLKWPYNKQQILVCPKWLNFSAPKVVNWPQDKNYMQIWQHPLPFRMGLNLNTVLK